MELKSKQDGYLYGYSTYETGRRVIEMGGGRFTNSDVIDPLVGLKFPKKIGDTVAETHAKDNEHAAIISEILRALVKIGSDKPSVPQSIKKCID